MVRDFIAYLRLNKKLWLLPFALVIGIAVLIAILIQMVSVSPFVYTLF